MPIRRQAIIRTYAGLVYRWIHTSLGLNELTTFEQLLIINTFVNTACINKIVKCLHSLAQRVLTHWGRDEIDNISQTTFSNVFSSMKMFEFRLKFHWSLFLKGPISNTAALVQIMAWRRPGAKPLSEPMMVSLPTHIVVTQPQWVNHRLFLWV